MSPIRVLIADDHPVLRTGVRTLLEGYRQIEIVGEATTGAETLALTQQLQPDVLLLDANLPDCDGVEVAQILYHARQMVQVLVLSAYDDMEYVRRFLAAGVSGYLLKEEAGSFLAQAVEAVARGETGWFSLRIQMQLIQLKQTEPTLVELTNREIEVLYHLATGKTNYAIAQALEISEKTVEKHLDAIYRKLNVRSRTEAAVVAIREHLI